MGKEVEIIGKLVKVEFYSESTPVILEKKNKDYIFYGEKNDYPVFIDNLYKKQAEHGAIIKSKVKYIFGKGLNIKETQDPRAKAFLERANRFESWNDVFFKTVRPFELLNGFAWQIIWSLGGQSFEVYSISFSKLRVSKDRKKVYYCDDWSCSRPESHESFCSFDMFNPNIRTGTQIYYYTVAEENVREYDDVYPVPEYCQVITNICTDIAVSEFQNSLAENGMTAQGMLSLFNGEPTEDEKKKYAKLFNANHTGPNRAGRIIFNFADPNTQGAEWTTFQTSDLDKQFELISKTNQEKIVTGHQVPNKSLVGIAVEGALGNRTEIVNSYEQFCNTYIEPRQNIILDQIKYIASFAGISFEDLQVVKLSPLGVDYLNENITKYMTNDEVREKLGLPPLNQNPDGTPSGQANENLQGLSGSDMIHINRVIRQVNQGKLSREAAISLLKAGYNMSDDLINTMLPVQMSAVKDYFDLYFNLSVEDSESDELVAEEYCFGSEHAKQIFRKYQFADGAPSEQLLNSVLDLVKGDPFIKPEKIAKILDADLLIINETLKELERSKLIVVNSNGSFTPTDAGNNKTVPPVQVEIYTVYKYVTRPDVPRASTSRPFCKKMLALSEGGRAWKREALDQLTNDIGEDAWAYRGGFYTNPETKEVTPYCRHVWKAVTRRRVKNG